MARFVPTPTFSLSEIPDSECFVFIAHFHVEVANVGHSMKDSICYVHDAQNSHERYTNTKNPAKNASTLVPELKKSIS